MTNDMFLIPNSQIFKHLSQIHLLKSNLSLPYNLDQATRAFGLNAHSNKTDFTCFKQDGFIFTLKGKPLKLIDQFTYFVNKISSTENNVIYAL